MTFVRLVVGAIVHGAEALVAIERTGFEASMDSSVTNFTQGIAFGSTVAEATARAQTMLVSTESCHVARTTRFSSGLGLLKCVMICSF